MTTHQRGGTLRQLRREVGAADDAQIRRLVALVDSVANRGEADQLIGQLRPRLAVLRPPRPLRVARLLFLPLDPLIMPPATWRPGAVGIPRVALSALSAMVVAELGPANDELSAMIAGHCTAEAGLVAVAGRQLWPRAAAVLRNATVPPGWTDATGLHTGEFVPLVKAVAMLLGEAATLWQIACHEAGQDVPEVTERLLRVASASGPQPMAMMVALLLAQTPQSGFVLQHADYLAIQLGEGFGLVPDRAMESLLSTIEGGGAAGGSRLGLQGLRWAATLLETLVAQSARRPIRAARLEKVRRHLEESCRAAFVSAAANLAPQAGAPDVPALEAAARTLRQIETIGRRLGGGAFYDKTMLPLAEQFRTRYGLALVERLRIGEILLGADSALALFGAPPGLG